MKAEVLTFMVHIKAFHKSTVDNKINPSDHKIVLSNPEHCLNSDAAKIKSNKWTRNDILMCEF